MKWIYDDFWFTHWRPGLRSSVTLAVLCCLWLAPALNAQAGIRACKQADGSTVFQDSACEVIREVQTQAKKRETSVPFGIDKTWFEKPPVVPDRAICTTNGCHCGMFSRKFKHGLPLAIADSLYLDGSWHRLDSTLTQLEDKTLSSIDMADLRRARDESACNILMSQQTLRLYGKEVMRDLNNKRRYAEDRGLDDPVDCDAGDLTVCEHTDNIVLFERIKNDIRSLANSPRIDDNERNELANSEPDY